MTIPTWAVIPSEGRPFVHYCVSSLRSQVDGIVIVANGGYTALDLPRAVKIVCDPEPRRNISRWWNLGLNAIEDLGAPRWNALVVNDDVIVKPRAVPILAHGLRSSEASLAFPGRQNRAVSEGDPERITGWLFMLRGEDGLRADERMEWWASDNDLDHRARKLNGAFTVRGVEHVHLDPNGYTNRVPELTEQAGRDVETFRSKWGRLPY